MKKKFLSVFTSLMVLFAMTACAQQRVTGSNNYISTKVNVTSFEGIKLLGSPHVVYTQKPGAPSVEVYGPDNIIPLIETYVEEGNLIVKYKNNVSINKSGKLEIRVTAPAISQASVSGSGNITLTNGITTNNELSVSISGSGNISGNKIKCSKLSAKVNGSGDIDLKGITTTNIYIHVSGSGDINVAGNGVNAEYSINGSGGIKGVNLQSQNVYANINGSGGISCYATEWLKGNVNGSGEVGYKGSPRIEFSKKGLHKL